MAEIKSFKEAFPGLKLDDKISGYFDGTTVTAATYSAKEDEFSFVLESSHMIPWMYLREAEKTIRRQVFGKGESKVRIRERYILSGQYNPGNVLKEYGENIVRELAEKDRFAERIFKKAERHVDGNNITFDLIDTHLNHRTAAELKSYLEGVYSERFGMNVSVDMNYVPNRKIDSEIESAEKESSGNRGRVVRAAVRSAEPAAMESGAAPTAKPGAKDVREKAYTPGGSETVKKKQWNPTDQPKRFSAGTSYGRKGRGKADPDCIYGRSCDGDAVSIKDVAEGADACVIKGQIISTDEHETKTGKVIYKCSITDFTDTINFKLFIPKDDIDVISEAIRKGGFYAVKGTPRYDDYDRELQLGSIQGIKASVDPRPVRIDDSEVKRVELLAHTKMSDMNSVCGVEELLDKAAAWNMDTVAITDYGGVQGFPVALKHNNKKHKGSIKIIYGLDAYLVNDAKPLVSGGNDADSLDRDYVVFDIETTGFSTRTCKIIEIGAVKVNTKGEVVGRFSEFVNPEEPIPYHIEQLTSISDEMVKDAPTIDVILPRFFEFIGDAALVAHNAAFDTGFIKEFAIRLGLSYTFTSFDTMTLAHVFLPELGRYTLDRLCKYFGVVNKHHHRAVDDADATALIFIQLYNMVRKSGIDTVGELNRFGRDSHDAVRKGRTHGGTILIKNETGRVNLYRVISESNITYFNRFPRIPMTYLNQYREGLLIGSGTSRGELYQAIEDGKPEDDIISLAHYFDYLEIQPPSNDMWKIDDEGSSIRSVRDLQDIILKIVELGKKLSKPVVATGDVHMLDPEDKIYRSVILHSGKEKVNNDNAPLYFRTTEEMLSEFAFLGEDKAYEVVVENTHKINAMIENISPVAPDKAAPDVPGADEELPRICYDRAHAIYGPDLPQIVESRLKRELDSIVGNGYAGLYMISQKLVAKSNQDGYLVGSRGSVGSSFVATMSGISEVNPLPPHYICPKCHFTDFDSDLMKQYSGMSGCDLPDRECPNCGEKLLKEGHDIPFETFLGFKGDKEPDIDLNFSGEYQPKAHKFIEEMFGSDHAFRAGTVGTVAEKTAFGLVRKYFEAKNIVRRDAEIARIAQGCTKVKRTTGQHPGGIIVTPSYEEIYRFTPVQKPANDMSTDIITTHFEYHAIQHNLLKFDILGHDDPTMVRRLQDLTGFDPLDVPLDDKKVLSLFHGTEALGITPDDIGGTKLGCLGIPEFGTDFAMQMVIDAKPESFSDLVRLSGLSHGTDVWIGNAKDLIDSGTCKLSSAICCRDDIMVYLIHMGLDSGTAFKIMENVRKGVVASGGCSEWEGWKQEMRDHGIPDWYMESCEKIKYMFPKAHAAAYVMMGWRVAYYKIYYPVEYYTAFFSIRADDFNYEKMCFGPDKLSSYINEVRATDKGDRTAKDEGLLRDMRLVQEMYARGYEFLPIDLYEADATRFKIINGKIMPSFISIDGMGETAAESLAQAAKEGEFLSKAELKARGKVSSTVIETMSRLGILGDMPDDAQLTFGFT